MQTAASRSQISPACFKGLTKGSPKRGGPFLRVPVRRIIVDWIPSILRKLSCWILCKAYGAGCGLC